MESLQELLGALAVLVAGGVVVCLAVGLYFLPSIIAWKRKHRQTKVIFWINLLFGWSFLGWLAVAVWAVATKD